MASTSAGVKTCAPPSPVFDRCSRGGLEGDGTRLGTPRPFWCGRRWGNSGLGGPALGSYRRPPINPAAGEPLWIRLRNARARRIAGARRAAPTTRKRGRFAAPRRSTGY
jgi:hypothetical protein